MTMPTSWRWMLSGGPGPAVARTLPFARAVRGAVFRAGNEVDLAHLPDAFHGGPGPARHSHAYYLPEDRDRDGRIDHVLVHAESGLDVDVLRALAATREVHWSGGSTVLLVPVWIGRPSAVSWFGNAASWRAVTPFVTPLRRTDRRGRERQGLDPAQQIARETARRGLPPVVAIDWPSAHGAGGFDTADGDFRPHSDALAGFPLVRFAEPVRGPLALGFGSHFGLGLMRPSRAEPGQ